MNKALLSLTEEDNNFSDATRVLFRSEFAQSKDLVNQIKRSKIVSQINKALLPLTEENNFRCCPCLVWVGVCPIKRFGKPNKGYVSFRFQRY